MIEKGKSSSLERYDLRDTFLSFFHVFRCELERKLRVVVGRVTVYEETEVGDEKDVEG